MQFGAMNLPRAPLPTPPPSLLELNNRLEIRQGNANTCGSLTDDGFVFDCDPDSVCVFNDASSVAGCCGNRAVSTSTCPYVTACYDSDAWVSYCDLECQSNPSIGSCTDLENPYCATVSYEGYLFSTFLCTDTSFGDVLVASLFSENGVASTTLLPGPTTDPRSSLPTTSTSQSHTVPPNPASTTPPHPSQFAEAHKTNGGLSTGAIAAIAIAGTVIILAAFALFYFMRRHKKAKLNRLNLLENQMSQQPTVGQWSQTVPSSQGYASKPDAMVYENETHDGTAYVGGAPHV